MRDKNLFRPNLQDIHTKAVKADDAEVETYICNGDDTELFQEVYRAKCHEPLLHHLRNIMANIFKRNVASRFGRYMVEAYVLSRSL